MNVERLVGIFLLMVAVWQAYSFVKGFNVLRTKSNKSTTAEGSMKSWTRFSIIP
ncbi:hypothetical protein [Pediococcus parvulus]|uniref:hypothetical protein n=1 Tax=Pediococcus parvulus TaxID=54062 RepID=UPI000B32EB5F|nr:hypothetical protein [Pediococcus parvulus]